MRKLFLYWTALITCLTATAQPEKVLEKADSTIISSDLLKVHSLNDVVVTANRTETDIDKVAVPITVITQAEIKKTGAVRLNEVLERQTGLRISSDLGQSVQIQGLDPEYTLILLDGQPLIGRTGGTFDLSRISLNNIERIEIVKGPTSSLYGSDALAGVINIISKKNINNLSTNLAAGYRTNKTINLSADLGYRSEKLGYYFYVDRLSSAGYDLTPETFGNTAPAYYGYTLHQKTDYSPNNLLKIGLDARFYTENQNSQFINTVNNKDRVINYLESRLDWTITPYVEFNFPGNKKLRILNHLTYYRTVSDYTFTDDGSLYDKSEFKQLFNRPEVQFDTRIGQKHQMVAGAGFTAESVKSTRYIPSTMRSGFLFLHDQWDIFTKLSINTGIRYDLHDAYQNRFSPKLALRYKPLRWLDITASYGSGYRAPDFRELLLDFTNPIAGYSIFGTLYAKERLAEFDAQGQISMFTVPLETIGEPLKAESSHAFNAGLILKPIKKIRIGTNYFSNWVKDMIDVYVVAQKTNDQNVFSYRNINRVITQGVETNLSYDIIKSLTLTIGYQYLNTKDVDAVEEIKSGNLFKKDPITQQTRRVRIDEYKGLPNRSAHSGNAQLSFNYKKIGLSTAASVVYTGPFGFADLNANLIIDDSSETSDGFTVLNLSVTKTLFQKLSIRLAADNITGTRNKYTPTLPGTLWSVGLFFNTSKTIKK